MSTADEPTTEPGFCRSTDGRLFATADQVRRCLKDEATAARVADAMALAGVATSTSNRELGRRLQVEEDRAAERSIADGRLKQNALLEHDNERLRRRPRVWQLALAVAAALAAGVATGYGVAELTD